MAAKAAPITEIGYTQTPNYNWWLYENETTPELIWPQSVYVYDQMRRQDAQVGSVLRAVTETLLRTPWRIDPAGARARVVKFVADDLGLPIVGKPAAPPPRLKDRFSWPSHLREALLMLPYGHSYFEQVYRPTDDGSAMHLRKLAYRPAKTIERIDVASDGGLVAIKQWWTATNTRPEPIPVSRLVAYIHAKEGGNWLGTSILRNCYKNWLLKDRLLRVQAQTIERNGMGIPLYTAAETETDLTAGLGMATSWRAGEAAGSAVPYGATLKLVGVEGTLPDALPVIEYHDAQIARAVLAHFLNLGQQTGSWALGTTFADFFTMSLQTLAEQIRDTATQHIVEDLVDINFGEAEPAPRLVFDEIGSRQAATAQAIKTLVDAGVIHPDQVLEESSRQQYGLPPADPATATVPPGTATATPPAPTQMGDTSPSVAAKSAPKGPAAPAADDDGLFPLAVVQAKYNPAQIRDPGGEDGGRWIKNPAAAAQDALNLAGRIELGPDERLVSSSKLNDSSGDRSLVFAAVHGSGGNDVRIGLVHPEDAGRWRAADKGGTAKLSTEELHRFRGDLDAGVTKAKASARAADKAWASGDDPTDPVSLGEAAAAEGRLSTAYADLGWDMYLTEDDPTSWNLEIRTISDQLGESDSIRLSPKETRTLLKRLDGIQGELSPVTAAAGVDTHPGGEELKHWWVYGPGAARWTTFTELYHQLREEITGKSDNVVKAITASWFHLRFGYWPGDHRNVHASGQPVDDEADEWEEAIAALLAALAELAGDVRAAEFDPSKHLRNPKGSPGGGRFRSTVDKLKDAISTHRSSGGKGDPFEGYDREQLRRVAVKRPGITLTRGESRDSISRKLLDDLGGKQPAEAPPLKKAEPSIPAPEPAPKPKAPPRKRAPRKAPAPTPSPAAETRPASTYDGPIFKYDSEQKRQDAEHLIDLSAQLELLPWGHDDRFRLGREVGALEEAGGFTDNELGHIRQQTLITTNTERWRRETRPDLSIEELRAEMAAKSKQALDGKPIAVRVTPNALKGILAEGRIKSQFETNRSNGELDPKWRARVEERWFGLQKDSDPKQRPIYGYVAVDGVRSVSGDAKTAGQDGNVLDQYGGIQVVLKDGVKDRTTVTWGDSLTIPDFTIPEPLNNPTWRSYALPTGGIGNGDLKHLDRDVNSQLWRERNYVEAQVHGGVSTSDIAEVILPKAPNAALRAELDNAGISWRVS